VYMFLVFILSVVVLFCQYHSQVIGKTRPLNDLLCVEWDVKLYSLTHCLNRKVNVKGHVKRNKFIFKLYQAVVIIGKAELESHCRTIPPTSELVSTSSA